MSRVGCSSLPHCTWYTHLVLLDEETSGTGNRSRISYFWQSTVLAAEDSSGLVHHKIFHLSCSLTECATGRSNLLAIPHNQLPCPLRRTTCCWYLLGVPDLKLCERLRTRILVLHFNELTEGCTPAGEICARLRYLASVPIVAVELIALQEVGMESHLALFSSPPLCL